MHRRCRHRNRTDLLRLGSGARARAATDPRWPYSSRLGRPHIRAGLIRLGSGGNIVALALFVSARAATYPRWPYLSRHRQPRWPHSSRHRQPRWPHSSRNRRQHSHSDRYRIGTDGITAALAAIASALTALQPRWPLSHWHWWHYRRADLNRLGSGGNIAAFAFN